LDGLCNSEFFDKGNQAVDLLFEDVQFGGHRLEGGWRICHNNYPSQASPCYSVVLVGN